MEGRGLEEKRTGEEGLMDRKSVEGVILLVSTFNFLLSLKTILYHDSGAGSEKLAIAPVCSCLSAHLSLQLWPPPTDAAPHQCSACDPLFIILKANLH